MSKPRITLKDIASACGVSANTVSRAMRGDDRLPESTRARIRGEAEKLGYIPNTLASSLRSGRTHTVAIIINDVRNLHFCSMLSIMDPILRASGYHVMILCMRPNGELGEEMIHTAISQSVDGIVFFPNTDDREKIQYIQEHHVPFVLLDRWAGGVEADIVRCDDEAGGFLAARSLLSVGHRKILFLSGPDFSSSQRDRLKGIRRAVEEAGLSQDILRVVPGDLVESAMLDGMLDRLLYPIDYTAVITFRDETAFYTLNCFRRRGISVPGDISLVSFDHLNSEFPYLPSVNSIYATESSVAEQGVHLLLARIHDPLMPVRRVLLPVMVYEGGTVAPPPQ